MPVPTLPYRSTYLDHAELTTQLKRWAEQHPDLVQLESIGQSEEGRELWLATVGRDLDRVRPSIWIDGNMHACELAGSSVALSIIEDMLALHAGDKVLPKAQLDRLLDVPFCVMPRISPDGAEAVLKTGRYVRSTPRDHRANRGHARWIREDINGDGRALMMRVKDSGGEFVESQELAGLMLPRKIDDEGPFYKIYPEGRIANYDGHTVPTPGFLSDNATDLNRNFPHSWVGEHGQIGAGLHPGSEPETRAVLEAVCSRPQLFAWINYHCFGGVFIRPLGSQADSKLPPHDLAIYKQLEAWADELTGYPMVSGFEEFTYEPENPIHGDLSDFAFHERGCVAFVVELWDLFKRIGMKRPKRFVDLYTNMGEKELESFARWDLEHNAGRSLRPWTSFDHPQLGAVEVGGIDFRVGVWNPPYEELDSICQTQLTMALRVAAMSPSLHLEVVKKPNGDTCELLIQVENRGYLGTSVLESARPLSHNEPIRLEVALDGPELVGGQHRLELAHLDGWGRGLGAGLGMPAYLPDRGSTHRGHASVAVRGTGSVTIRVGSCRMGFCESVVNL